MCCSPGTSRIKSPPYGLVSVKYWQHKKGPLTHFMRHKMHKSSCNYDCILVLFLLMFFFPSLPLVKTFGIMECVKCRAVFAWWGACEEFGWVQYIKVICQVRQLRVKNGIIGHQMLNWEWNFRKQNNWDPD
jgi:hypothetical protein